MRRREDRGEGDMAEARPEQEDTARREQVVRRPPSSAAGRPDRRKPEHRHSQGPLSSIRAAIKRTSTSSTSSSEASRDRDRERDRRRPEITILSAEPLSSASWFPGASAGFPPPPPPAAQIWGPTIPPSVQPPPSYEEVIREKTQEQVFLPPPSSSSSLITISTQTDTGSAPRPEARGPERPPRPPLCRPPRPSLVDDITLAASRSSPDLLAGPCRTSTSGAKTDQRDHSFAAAAVPTPPTAPPPPAASSPDPSERPRPRPRTRLSARPIDSDVRVQTLVKLREDGAATLAARAGATADQEAGQGKYLQELLQAFSTDDWGFPDRRSDSSGDSQSESEEEEEEEEDMATLRARILAFEQQQGADGSGGEGDFVVAKRPEPRPRPRLQGQPAKSVPPTVAPKPKSLSQTPKPSSKVFWEDGGLLESSLTEAQTEPAPPMNAAPALEPPLCSNAEKPSIPPKPTDPPAPVPAPRPPPPKSAPSLGDPANLKPPPRPPVAPRAPPQDKSAAAPPTLPARPSVEAETGDQAETRDADKQTVKVGSRPGVPTKPAALVSPRRASAPNLAPKPAAGAAAPRPSGPTAGLKPPAPALRKGPRPGSTTASPNPSDPPLPPRPSSAKHLPLRPPPIKSTPGRPPPPTISSAYSANQTAPPPDKTGPAPSAGQCSPLATTTSCSPVSANQMQPQPASKKGPPLPPRPKSGHPLYDRYVKQEVLIVLDDPPPSEHSTGDGGSQTVVHPQQCLLDVDTQPGAPLDQDGQSKPSMEGLGLSESQSILPIEPKEKPDPPPVSGPRCVALFDYEGEEDDELTFSQGDVIGLLQLVGAEWGRGQIHGRVGVFPLNFVEVVEPLGGKPTATPSAVTGSTEPEAPPDPPSEEWAEALFDFPAQTADDLSFHKGALIQVMEHLDPQWRRGRLEGREGIYPAAFTQRCQAQPITGQQTAVRGVAKFDFTAESEDELTLKVGDIITQVEFVDEQWILGVVDQRRGIVPKNYISLL